MASGLDQDCYGGEKESKYGDVDTRLQLGGRSFHCRIVSHIVFFLMFLQIEETLEKAGLQLHVELWYTENALEDTLDCSSSVGGPSENGSCHQQSSKEKRQQQQPDQQQQPQHNPCAIECVSSRVFHLRFRPSKGLHYHLPVLFDYFHLSAASMTVHCVLTSLHQPYIK